MNKPPNNGPINVEFNTMNIFLARDIEAELREFSVKLYKGSYICISLKEMVHNQPPTTAVTYIATGYGVFNENIRQQGYLENNMIFYWVRDRVIQRQFLVYWVFVKHNMKDYFTKRRPEKHHRLIRSTYLFFIEYVSDYACYMSPHYLQEGV